MFNGRQSEELYNPELYKLFEVLQHIIDVPVEINAVPTTNREGALWLDRNGSSASLKYYDEGDWKVIFQDRFKILSEILSATQPDSPVAGQLWLNDGMLMYFSGSEWLPVKSVNIDSEFNISSFEQFLIINPIPAAGNLVIVYRDTNNDGNMETLYFSQFLLPSEEMDRFFINGLNITDYEVVSNVAIQYDSNLLQGKVASAVHVNPAKLAGITKKLIFFDKLNPIIQVPEVNTEFYGFSGGMGKLLLKADDVTTDYISTAEGIQLSPVTALMYDYVMAIAYKFKDVKNIGYVDKRKIVLGGSDSIFIGQVADLFCVFVQGMFLSNDSANYTYDSVVGTLSLPLEAKLDVGVVAFPFVETGIISQLNGAGKGIINSVHTYTQPMVLVYGTTLQALTDFTIGTGADAGKIFVDNALPGMSYAVVETMGGTEDAHMFVKQGVLTSNALPCSFVEMSGDSKPILFLNGILIASEDIRRDSLSGEITVTGMVSNMEYILLKDPSSRLLFNGQVNFITVPTELMDDAVVYLGNQLICDSSAVYTSVLPAVASVGEVKLLLDGLNEFWYKYQGVAGWVKITDQATIDDLAATALGYSTSRRSISFLQNFGYSEGVAYAYRFANSVQEPLLRGVIHSNAVETLYNVGFSHTFPPGKNAIAVWLNGIRQYQNTSIDPLLPNGIIEVDYGRIELPIPIAANLFYVIERPERNESKSCYREILTMDSKVIGTSSVYQTTIPLYPGNLRVFVGGLRIPATSYSIIDAYTLMIKFPTIGGLNNYPTEDIIVGMETRQATHVVYDKILIETRQDFGLREVTVPIRYAGQKEWSIAAINIANPLEGGDGIPRSLLDSKDFIMIYINGFAYGKEYIVDPIRESIILTNDVVTSVLGVDYLEQFFLENHDKYLEWLAANNNLPYIPKPIKDKITFEWR